MWANKSTRISKGLLNYPRPLYCIVIAESAKLEKPEKPASLKLRTSNCLEIPCAQPNHGTTGAKVFDGFYGSRQNSDLEISAVFCNVIAHAIAALSDVRSPYAFWNSCQSQCIAHDGSVRAAVHFHAIQCNRFSGESSQSRAEREVVYSIIAVDKRVVHIKNVGVIFIPLALLVNHVDRYRETSRFVCVLQSHLASSIRTAASTESQSPADC